MHMTKIPQTPTRRYANYHLFDGEAMYGSAEFLRGKGWLFRQDEGPWMEIIEPHDITIGRVELFGFIDMRDRQLALDIAKREAGANTGGGQACCMIGCRGDETCEAGQAVVTQLTAIMAV